MFTDASVSWRERLWTIGFPKGFDPGLWTWATCSYIPMTLLGIMWILAACGSSPAAPFLCPGLCQVQHQVPRHIRLCLHFVVSLLGKLGLHKRNTWQLSGALTHCWKRAWGKKYDQEETWRLRDNSNLTGNQALREAGMNKDLGKATEWISWVASFMFNCLPSHELLPYRVLCPWDSPGKNTGMGCHALLQGDLFNPEIKPRSLYVSFIGRRILYH